MGEGWVRVLARYRCGKPRSQAQVLLLGAVIEHAAVVHAPFGPALPTAFVYASLHAAWAFAGACS